MTTEQTIKDWWEDIGPKTKRLVHIDFRKGTGLTTNDSLNHYIANRREFPAKHLSEFVKALVKNNVPVPSELTESTTN